MTPIDPAEIDDHGEWTGTCDRCGTDHDGYPPGTIGGALRCARTRALHLGLNSAVEAADAVNDRLGRERDRVLHRHFHEEAHE